MSDNLPVITALTAAGDSPPGIERVRDHATLYLASDAETLARVLPDSDILLVIDFRTDALAAAWHSAEKLKWVHAASAGVNHLMFDELKASDVVLTNARGIFDRAIAEYVLGVILLFAKDTRSNIEFQAQHKWCHRDTETLGQKRVLVVGAGAIGHEIGSICRAVGMRVNGIARSEREGDSVFEHIYPNEALHEQLAGADYVVIAAPLTEATRGLFDGDAFVAMKPSARLINVGRGPIVNTDALLQALDAKQLAGAALDVFEQEPLPPAHPLWDRPNVLISAHMAGDFIGWRAALIDQFLDNFAHWQCGEALFNVVKK